METEFHPESPSREPRSRDLAPGRKRLYLTREPAIIALLCSAAVVCFGAVSALSSIYHAQYRDLGTHWFDQGNADLKDHHFKEAAEEFRTALLYSRDNYNYQLNLAEALLGQKQTRQAEAYLTNLWDREPGNGLVNLELARIAAQQQEPDDALRFYHNAIYAAWPADAENPRQKARLELISYLLKTNNRAQAQAELIALAGNLGSDPALEIRVANLFVQAKDYTDALSEYRLSLKHSSANPEALQGAGEAAFELGQYRVAQQYLQSALTAGSADPQIQKKLQIAELVLRLDPFRRIGAAERERVIEKAFEAAGDRLDACGSKSTASGAPGQTLADQWDKMKPDINDRGFRRDPALAEKATELVFEIERQSGAACGPPTPVDEALLRIAKLHEGN